MARSGDMDITWNHDTLNGLLRSPQIVQATQAIAEKGAEAARASAPVDSGDYQRGIRVIRREAKYRTVFRVTGTDAKTMIIESKTGNLARALKGLRS